MYKKDNKAQNWFITINNNTENDEKLIEDNLNKFEYIAIGKHIGEKKKVPHIHLAIKTKTPQRFSALKKLFPRGEIEKLQGTFDQAFDYLNKEGKTWEEGVRPVSGAKATKDKWEEVRRLAKEGKVEEIEAKFYIQHYNTLQRIAVDNKAVPETLNWTETPNEWHYGPSGSGKSKKVREENNDIYLKMCNKWWDNYRDEAVVLIEDFDISHKVLVHHLKIWADRYGFRAERKMGTVVIRPNKVIITSNFHPRDIWTEEGDIQPILRRFEVIEYK